MSIESAALPAPSAELLDELDGLIKKDQILTIWNKIQAVKPLAEWGYGEPRRMAGLLASRLGNRRLGEVLDYLNYRQDRNHPKWSLYYQFRRVTAATQPVVIQKINEILTEHRNGMEPELLADYLVYKAWLLASLRDFDRANALVEEAKQVAPDYSWVYVEESDILEKQDRYEEANEAADHALKLHPEYHAAVLRKETALIHLNRDEEAIALLNQAHEQAEHGVYAIRLLYRYSEQDDHEKMLWALGEYERLSPLLGKKDKEWLAGRRGDSYYLKGNLDKTLECYQKTKSAFYKAIVKNLEKNKANECSRKKLDVAFVRQHEMTCAPATLAALSEFYHKEIDHLEIADAICYDGTPWHKERTWAEENGFAVFEFRFTEEITKSLIDRNLPFTLSTQSVTSGHLQACIGYDDRLGIAIIRDPTHRHYGEMLIDQLIKNHPVYGPRGMLIIPTEQSHVVDELIFPDQDLYDNRHRLMLAIDAHDELKMQEAVSTMRVINAEHPLVINSEISLENYRSNRPRVFALQKLLHERFPENESLEYDYFYSSQSHCGREEQLEIGLKAVEKKYPDPVFYAMLGDLYLENLRELDTAEYYLKKAAKNTFSNARSMASLALCSYRKNALDEATDFRRYASCQSPGWEHYAYQYFQLSTESDRVEQALTYLKARTISHGNKQSAPWITLSRAYEAINDDTKSREVALKALEQFPNDGELLVYMASSCYAWGYGSNGEQYLEAAKPLLSDEEWNHASGRLAANRGDRQKALRHYKRALEIDPDYYQRQSFYCDMLEEEYGQDYVLDYLEKLVAEHQNSASILELYATKLVDFSHDGSQAAVEALLEKDPNNLWAMRELSLLYEKTGEVDKAQSLAEMCLEKQPNAYHSYGVLAGIYARNHRLDEAVKLFKKALLLDADYTFAIKEWLSYLESDNDKLDAIKFYKKQLDVQPVDGGSINEYRDLAYRYIEPEELLLQIQTSRKRRAGEWAAWIAEKDQLLDMGRVDDAAKLMAAAEERFPFIPRIYIEKASIYRAMGDVEQTISSLEKALELSPSWDWAARQLAESLEYQGDTAKAEATLRQAILWSPLNPANTGCLVDLLGRIGKDEEAFDSLADELKRSPMYGWGWREIARWSLPKNRESEVLSLLELHHKTHGESKSWWSICFDVYSILEENEKALEYCNTCLEKDPKYVDMHDSKAYLLAKLKRYDEAILATTPEVFGQDISPVLQWRKALIVYSYKGLREALPMMETLAEKHPNYLPAVRSLTKWYDELEDDEKVEKYGLQWRRLDPQSHVVLGYLGAIYEKQKKLKEAADCFDKAFQIESEYSYAGYRAFELHLASRDLDKIPQIIQLTGHFGRYTESLEMRARYLHALGKKEEAIAAFKELLIQEDVMDEEIGKTETLFPKVGSKLINAVVEQGEAKSKGVLQAWLWGKKNFFGCADKIVKLPYPSEMKYPLWQDLINWMLEFEDAAEMVRKLKNKYYDHFSENTYAWGLMLQASIRFRAYDVGCAVFHDEKKHEDIEDWMLTNAAYCQIAEYGLLAAEPTIDRGLQLRSETGADFLLSMKAILEAGRGNIGRAEEFLEARDDTESTGVLRLGLLAKKMIACMTGDQLNQKMHWLQFQEEEPEWRTKKHIDQIMSFCKQSAKASGNKWIGGQNALRAKINGSNYIWWILGAFFLIRMIYRMIRD